MAGSNFFRLYTICFLIAFLLHCWVAFSHLFIYDHVVYTRENNDHTEPNSIFSLSTNYQQFYKNLVENEIRRVKLISKPFSKDNTNGILTDCHITKGKFNILENEETGIEYLYKPINDSLKNYEKRILTVKDDNRDFFINFNTNNKCLKEGIHMNQSLENKECICLDNWHGNSCSIPDVVWYSSLKLRKKYIKPAEKNRKIINAFPFSIEFELLDARFSELGDIVDVFLILESTYSAHGDKKPLYLYNQLQKGKYKKFRDKIVHVLLDYFPKEAYKNGWIIDDLLRNHLAKEGLRNQLKNLDHNDIFLLSDADELPTRSSVLFLKVNKNYPEPVGINLSWRTYGFFYGSGKGITHVITATTIGFLTHVFSSNAIWIRSAPAHIQTESSKLNAYLVMKKQEGSKSLIGLWSFGNTTHPAGWHCSWCASLDRIRVKLTSAQNGDFPRWGDFPQKRKLTYIAKIVREGLWFDDTSKMTFISNITHFYAPCGLLHNPEKYKHVLNRNF